MEQRVAEDLELLLHEEARHAGVHELRHALGGGVGPMGRAEGVIHVDVAECAKGLAEGGIVLLLTRLEAAVLEQHDLARLHRLDDLRHLRAHQVVRLRYLGGYELGQSSRDGVQAELRRLLALRPAEVARQNDLRPCLQEVVDRRQGRPDAAIVSDAPILVQRHVEVDADEDALAFGVDIGD